MRLVCDKCSAVYTIDDGLVGKRDFRVSCKSCGKPIVVKSAKQVTYAATQRVKMPGAALPPLSLQAAKIALAEGRSEATPLRQAPRPGEGWFVTQNGRQQGPLTAEQMAGMLEAGTLDWGTEVWRQGLKGWRAARRDPMLVTSIAGARGVANDTTRLDAARSFLAPEDTVVEARPNPLGERSLRDKIRPGSSAADSTPLPAPLGRGGAAKAEPLPDLSPSARPQAWHSPENTAFREALGLPTDSSQQSSAFDTENAAVAAAPLSAPPSSDDAAATLGDAFGSVPRLFSESRGLSGARLAKIMAALEGLPARVLAQVDSHYLVGAGAFLAGVLCTLMLVGQSPVATVQPVAVAHAEPAPNESPAVVAEAPRFVAEQAASAVLPVATVQGPVSSALTSPAPVLRELPTVEELRAEVRKVAVDVKRCMDNPGRGVDVDIYLDGPSGRVRDLDVRSGALGPGRVACIRQAVRRIQLPPFSRRELKLMHKFSW